jgi:hypothetical protein
LTLSRLAGAALMSALRPVEALRQFLMDPWWYKSWSGISSQLEEAGRWKDRKNIALSMQSSFAPQPR